MNRCTCLNLNDIGPDEESVDPLCPVHMSTRGLTDEQRRVLARLPESVREDWVNLCQQFEVMRVQPGEDYLTPRGGWAIDGPMSCPPQGTFAESPLELIEVMRGWMK